MKSPGSRSDILLQAEQVLMLLAKIPAVRQGTPEAGEIFATLLREHEEYTNLGVADLDGRLLRVRLAPGGGPLRR